jgi:hypothetical protein
MTTIVYNISGKLNPGDKDYIKETLDRLYVQEAIASYNINENVLTIITIYDDPSIIFNLGSVVGLAIAASLNKSKYVSK